MAHSNSRVWVSPRDPDVDALYSRWVAVHANLARMRFDRSPFIPHSFEEFKEHTAAFAGERAQEARIRMENIIEDREAARRTDRPPLNTFDGKQFHDNRSPVLALPSIWSPWFQEDESRPIAPWPSAEEYKEEGDERHTSGFGRFLPVPRVPGNETVVWKQKAFLEPYELDHVSPVFNRTPHHTLDDEISLAQMPIKMFTDDPTELSWMAPCSSEPTPAQLEFSMSWESTPYDATARPQTPEPRQQQQQLQIEWQPASAKSSRVTDTVDSNTQLWDTPSSRRHRRQSEAASDETLRSPPTRWSAYGHPTQASSANLIGSTPLCPSLGGLRPHVISAERSEQNPFRFDGPVLTAAEEEDYEGMLESGSPHIRQQAR